MPGWWPWILAESTSPGTIVWPASSAGTVVRSQTPEMSWTWGIEGGWTIISIVAGPPGSIRPAAAVRNCPGARGRSHISLPPCGTDQFHKEKVVRDPGYDTPSSSFPAHSAALRRTTPPLLREVGATFTTPQSGTPGESSPCHCPAHLGRGSTSRTHDEIWTGLDRSPLLRRRLGAGSIVMVVGDLECGKDPGRLGGPRRRPLHRRGLQPGGIWGGSSTVPVACRTG